MDAHVNVCAWPPNDLHLTGRHKSKSTAKNTALSIPQGSSAVQVPVRNGSLGLLFSTDV
jgi:hypothetical protein